MLDRRTLLAGLAAPVPALASHDVAQRVTLHPTVEKSDSDPHRDAAVFAICDQLRAQQAEWQRLWTLTSDSPDVTTDADEDWLEYSQEVWPATDRRANSGDLLDQLGKLRATTPESIAAKCAALVAADAVGGYTGDCRVDMCELMASATRDAAGAFFFPLGEAAPHA